MTNDLSITKYLNADLVQSSIKETLGDRTQQFITSVVSLVNANQALQNCDRKSLMSACLTAASLDLPINQNLGFAYIIPYKDKAQFQIGYKGFIQLAQRSGQFKTINTSDVREGEIKSYDRETGKITFNWAMEGRDKLKVVGYTAYISLINGFEKTIYMTVDELTKHANKYSQSFKANRAGTNLWRDEFDTMARKTMIKFILSQYAPLSSEMQQAQIVDQAVIEGETIQYPDNGPVDHDELTHGKERMRLEKHIKEAKTTAELDELAKNLGQFPELDGELSARMMELETEGLTNDKEV